MCVSVAKLRSHKSMGCFCVGSIQKDVDTLDATKEQPQICVRYTIVG